VGVLFATISALCAPVVALSSSVQATDRPFAHAYERGTLIVGVPYVTPDPQAGAKIRTEERLDTKMAQTLGEQLGLPVRLLEVDAVRGRAAVSVGDIDVLLTDRIVPEASTRTALPVAEVSTGYVSRPKAIIRSDTPLRDWKDVASMTVCMSSAAFLAKSLASQQGATVRTYSVPSDALVAVRQGDCDIGVVDDVMWTALMTLPEWKNFSSTLNPVGPRAERVWVTDGHPTTRAWLDDAMSKWTRNGVLDEMVTQWARDIAFDVYLDQEVPDCHTGLP